jgi:hypothetical protein
MYSHYAFVSESGNYGFDFDGDTDTNYFVVTAVLIADNNIESVRQKLADIQIDQVPMESSLKDQEKIINQLLTLEFQIYCVVIDKKKLHHDGGHGSLKYSFEFMNEIIYQDLFSTHLDMQVYADDKETLFIKSFDDYINDRHQPDLFNRSVFLYENRRENRFIQLTDYISNLIFGTYAYDQSILNKLSSKIIRFEKYPTLEFSFNFDNKLDHLIATQAILAAQSYIKYHQKSEIQVNVDRVNILKFLLTQLSIKPNKYIYSQEIIENLRAFSAETISKDYLMSDIIGPLRDAGVLIASTSKGYKIPTSTKDLADYVEFSSSMALPILRRIEKGRERVLEITNNELDIIEGEKFWELRNFFRIE